MPIKYVFLPLEKRRYGIQQHHFPILFTTSIFADILFGALQMAEHHVAPRFSGILRLWCPEIPAHLHRDDVPQLAADKMDAPFPLPEAKKMAVGSLNHTEPAGSWLF